MYKPTVLDIFCGAGGFSEGFRQQGFEIVHGIDNWLPAINTFNHNFGLECQRKNILDYEYSVDEISKIPDTDIIIGSPPCVSFSTSNNSGKADKSNGLQLIKIFFRIIAVKKFQKNSKLKAWLMENVVNSKYHIQSHYTFEDLNLRSWAKENNIIPSSKAIILDSNYYEINSADYGSPQRRIRAFSGEIIELGILKSPSVTHSDKKTIPELPKYLTVADIRNKLPKPNALKSRIIIQDPLYQKVNVSLCYLMDHFYDTGLYEQDWQQSKYQKVNHPYMGRMSFPEDENRPSRTIVAMNIGSSRESIIYKSEYKRKGNGEYRVPTVREAACLMSFPITYQFLGSQGTKMRLVGNSVCPSVSRAFAGEIRRQLKLPKIKKPIVSKNCNLKNVDNLNTYKRKIFGTPSKRAKNSRFRMHPFKDGNISVTLSNFHIESGERSRGQWITSVQYGNGKGFYSFKYPNNYYKKLRPYIKKLSNGENFIKIIENGFSNNIGKGNELQQMYELKKSFGPYLEPTKLIQEIVKTIESLNLNGEKFVQKREEIFKYKKEVPLKQLFALYAINLVSTVANLD